MCAYTEVHYAAGFGVQEASLPLVKLVFSRQFRGMSIQDLRSFASTSRLLPMRRLSTLDLLPQVPPPPPSQGRSWNNRIRQSFVHADLKRFVWLA